MNIEINGEIEEQKDLINFKDSLKELCSKYDLFVNFCDNGNEEIFLPSDEDEEDDYEY